MPQFDSKIFNGEVFQKYVDRVPNTRLNELIKSKAVTTRADLAQAMADQVGGNYITTPLKGLISGSQPLNYDGVTDITSQNTKTFSHSRVVVGRANAWTEKDFSYDITGGVDFMENVAQQVAEYWDEIDQETLIHILKGIFNMSDVKGLEFVNTHTSNITGVQNSEGKTGYMDATSLNSAIQKACGDHKNKFSLAIMHSSVATNLENMKILVYLKYNDADGMQRDAAMATLNGRLVLIDDTMPVKSTEVTAGNYEFSITTKATAGDKIIVNGVTLVAGTDFSLSTDSTNGNATAIKNALNASTNPVLSAYTWDSSSSKVTAVEKTGSYGFGAPTVAVEQAKTGTTITGTLVVGAVATTQPAVVNTEYTTYIFGDGAIEYTNCGVKTPAEMYRDPKTNGGQDTLYNRQRKCFAPYGISFTKQYMATNSPTNAELELGSNWELVNTGGAEKEYISLKAIPIARIISLG